MSNFVVMVLILFFFLESYHSELYKHIFSLLDTGPCCIPYNNQFISLAIPHNKIRKFTKIT